MRVVVAGVLPPAVDRLRRPRSKLDQLTEGLVAETASSTSVKRKGRDDFTQKVSHLDLVLGHSS